MPGGISHRSHNFLLPDLSSSRGGNWPELPGKYILIALKSAMLEWPTDIRRTPAAAFLRARECRVVERLISMTRSQEGRTGEAAADHPARCIGFVCF